MAKKNTTPQSVLDAPKLTPVYVVRHYGPNRATRRHWFNGGNLVKPRWVRMGRRKIVPRRLREVSINRPHRKQDRT